MTQETQATLPALRPVEAIRVRHAGCDYLLLRDPQGVAPDPLLVPAALAGLLGQRQKLHDYLYWESNQFERPRNDLNPARLGQAVRMGDWKAVRYGTRQPLELYNLKLDLGETTNLAAQQPGVVKRIEKIMQTAHRDTQYWPIREEGTPGVTDWSKGAGKK